MAFEAAMDTKLEYRPDIDGLRAVAVSVVILYHFGAAWLPGGFVGVDVFFVISGYLIARLIIHQLEGGNFSFVRFYTRRARRLFPALLATIVFSFCAALLLFSPEDFAAFGGSMVHTALSVSNFYFWSQSGYFDANAITKPLLHTWSLSVEEQFYVVFPILTVLVVRRLGQTAMLYVLLAGGAISLGSSYVAANGVQFLDDVPGLGVPFQNGPATIFFLAPFRAFEFVIGSLIVWLPTDRLRRVPVALHDAVFMIGLGLIFYAAVTYSADMFFPAHSALLPCVGAAMTILSGSFSRAKVLLSNRLLLFVGLISYSLYLVHWPVLVFYSYFKFGEVSDTELWILGCVTLALSILLYFLVEQPVRKGRRLSPPAFGFASAVACLFTVFVSSNAWANHGWEWRLDNGTLAAVGRLEDAVPGALGTNLGCDEYCVFGDGPLTKTILVVGDSHVNHYTKALLAFYGDDYRFELYQSASCFFGEGLRNRPRLDLEPSCIQERNRLKARLRRGNIAGVIQGQRWTGYSSLLDAEGNTVPFRDRDEMNGAMIDSALRQYEGAAYPVVLVSAAPPSIRPCLARPRFFDCSSVIAANDEAFAAVARTIVREHPQAAFVDPADRVCPNQRCMILWRDQLVYSDGHHLSFQGTRLVVNSLMAPFTR